MPIRDASDNLYQKEAGGLTFYYPEHFVPFHPFVFYII